MKIALYPLPILALTVFLLIRAELRKDHRQIYIFKPISTLLLIMVAALSLWETRMNMTYTTGVLVGLVLCLGGDIALMFQSNRKAFTLGLVLFLLAHLVYTSTFTRLDSLHSNDWISALVLFILASSFYRWILPGLGTMKIPVALYITVISVMVNQALSTFSGSAFTSKQAGMIFIGALLFYISDIMLAVNRYGKPFKYQRISLAFYYFGQFLIALTASYFI